VPDKLNCRWLLGSPYENYLARQFRTARIVAVDSDESDPEGIALHRNSYSRELKLAAIEWATSTYRKGKKDGDPDKKITRYAAAKRLGITTTMLRTWIRNRAIIASQKKGSRRNRTYNAKGKEDEIERALY
jgi:transposase-like protein